jgi:hypothetical protein
VVFPPTNAGSVDLEPAQTGSLTPGAYAYVAVKSRATLTLASGTYYMTGLDLEPQAVLQLNQPVNLYVQSDVIDHGQTTTVSGRASSFRFGHAGTSTFFVESPFPGGTLIAPNAEVMIESLGTNAFVGKLFAQSLEVQPGAFITCE